MTWLIMIPLITLAALCAAIPVLGS